jgi:urease accessory protein
MLVLTQRLSAQNIASAIQEASYILALDAEERSRCRRRFMTVEGEEVNLQLSRGTVLLDGDLLWGSDRTLVVKVIAKPEPVVTATAHNALELLRAAYHLGNRHVPLEVTTEYLRLSPDPVLENMLVQLGLHVKAEILPFLPESGAYGSGSHTHDAHEAHSHSHDHAH